MSPRLFSDGGAFPRPVSPIVVTNDNGEEVTIVARGADAVGSEHRYVTVIDSDGDLYLVGFGDATDSGYLTSNGQWGNGNDLPETMEFGSFMAAYYNDSTEGINNLAVLPALAGVGVTFDQTMVTFNGTDFFVPGYACVDGVLHMYNNDVDVGWFYDDDSLVGHGHLDCEGGIVSGTSYPGNNHELLSPSELTVEGESAQSYRDAFYTLVMILTGHINYTWAD